MRLRQERPRLSVEILAGARSVDLGRGEADLAIRIGPVTAGELVMRKLCEVDVPIHAGADRPLVLPLSTGQHVHGADGMGDIGLPLAGRSPVPGHAVDALLAASHRHAGSLTLVTYEQAIAIQLGDVDAGFDQRMQTFDATWAQLSPSERSRTRAVPWWRTRR